jgi:hypothetical protein
MLYNLSFKHKIPEDAIIIDITSRSHSSGRLLSPFNLGPVDLYDGYKAWNVENGYQFSKIYPELLGYDGNPGVNYFEWAQKGWNNKTPIKYPFGAWTNCLYHWWKGKKLNRLEAQNQIFLPLYKQTVVKTETYKELKNLYETSEQDIYLLDFEGYNHRMFDMNWEQVINHPHWPVGQGFVLCMLLEGYL